VRTQLTTVEVSNYVSADTVGFREPGKVTEIEWYARHEWKTWFCLASDIQHEQIAGNSTTPRPHDWSSDGGRHILLGLRQRISAQNIPDAETYFSTNCDIHLRNLGYVRNNLTCIDFSAETEIPKDPISRFLLVSTSTSCCRVYPWSHHTLLLQIILITILSYVLIFVCMNSIHLAYSCVLHAYQNTKKLIGLHRINRTTFLKKLLLWRFGSIPGHDLPLSGCSTHSLDTPHSVGLLWTSDQPEAQTCIWQHTPYTRLISMPPAGFKPTIPASERRVSGHWDRLKFYSLDYFRALPYWLSTVHGFSPLFRKSKSSSATTSYRSKICNFSHRYSVSYLICHYPLYTYRSCHGTVG
jgi:hypothetical protein